MSNSTNKVYQVLVVPGTATGMVVAGKTLDELAVGQLGVFDSKTNLSINPDGSTIPENIYLAVKNPNGTIDFSAGQEIQAKRLISLSRKNYQGYVPFTAEIGGGFLDNLKPNTDYVLRLEVHSTEILQRQGTVQYTHAIVVSTGEVADPKKFLQDFKSQVSSSLSTDAMFTLEIRDTVGVVDVDTFDPADAADVKIRIIGSKTFTNEFYDINTRFQNVRQTTVTAAFPEGYLGAGATYTVTEAGKPEEGSGYNVRQMEYFGGGWNKRPGIYRQSSVTGLALPGFKYNAKENGKYNLFTLSYANHSVAGWGDYNNDIMTIVAVDSEGAQGAGNTTALLAFLNALASKFSVNYSVLT